MIVLQYSLPCRDPQERLCKELADIKELHAFEKEEAILQEQETAAALRKELEKLRLVCPNLNSCACFEFFFT